jgi:hypothetical protein
MIDDISDGCRAAMARHHWRTFRKVSNNRAALPSRGSTDHE